MLDDQADYCFGGAGRKRNQPRHHVEGRAPQVSTRMEGVHLRMGFVARGGIRWSDRREDFRTEVLGLMKAQQVKNTVIVPVGAKGGFVVRRVSTGDRDAQLAEVIACYQTLIRGMLDLTDNIVDDKILPPQRVVRHDGDDAYLVVAADKGTATFSDIANAISAGIRFLAGRRFRFRRLRGLRPQENGHHRARRLGMRQASFPRNRRRHSEPGFHGRPASATWPATCSATACCSRRTSGWSRPSIINTFSWTRIPTRRARSRNASGYSACRARPGRTTRRPAISKGGGVYSRSAKSLTLSREAQALLELPAQATPNEVIKAILKAHVDLLWNGGIGTYVKASSESNSDVGDRSNDAVRIDAAQLNCKVVGEGGNLGFSQLGRIEFARRGGRLNTDFIDNSAGVNCSDVEVNLKILLNGAVRARRNHARRARPAAGADDRRGGRRWCSQQLSARTGDQHRRVPIQGAAERERVRDPRAGAVRRSESRTGIPALRGGDRRAAQGRRGSHPARARDRACATARSGCTRR